MRSFVRGRTAATLSLTLCLLASQVMAAPGAPAGGRARLLGEVTAFGQVQVNGAEAASGETVFPGSRFTTSKKSSAVVNLGASGRVRLAPQTDGTLDFGEQSLGGALAAGAMTVSKPGGVAAVFTTKDVQVVPEQDSEAVFTLDVTRGNTVVKAEAGRVELRSGKTTKVLNAGESAAVGTQNTQNDDDDDDDKGGLFWLGVVGFVGEVGGAIIWALSQDDEGTGSPNQPPIIISPVRG
ncbi:MAG TPA: hypothetical protein VF736_18760 [Pyrinomonadaceae bacterium]